VRELPAGDYRVELLDGWRMEREVSSGFEPIDAALTSANPLAVTIDVGATTRAVFSFDTDGLPIHSHVRSALVDRQHHADIGGNHRGRRR
jgi:hypothetical protein